MTRSPVDPMARSPDYPISRGPMTRSTVTHVLDLSARKSQAEISDGVVGASRIRGQDLGGRCDQAEVGGRVLRPYCRQAR